MKSFATFLLAAVVAAAADPCNRDCREAKFAVEQAKLDTAAGSFKLFPKTDGWKTPESCFWDKVQDKTFVSNINGNDKKEMNGFISRIGADGKVDIKFIKEKLNAPKGVYVYGESLWVSDIDEVKEFNAKTGAWIQTIAIPKTDFLNDVYVDVAGTVYVSDSGLISGNHAKFDAVYYKKKDEKKFSVWSNGKTLDTPNGITKGEDGSIVVTSFGSTGVYVLPKGEQPAKATKTGAMMIDGIEKMKSGDYAISSWRALGLKKDTVTTGAIYTGKVGTADWKVEIDGLNSPADIGYNSKTNQVLVPHFKADELRFYPMDKWAQDRRGCTRDCKKAADQKFKTDKKDDMKAWTACNASCNTKFTGAAYLTIGASIFAMAALLQ